MQREDNLLSGKMLHLYPFKIISSTYLIIPFSLIALKSLFNCYVELSNEYKEAELLKKRHNCVVMLRDKIFTGWPPYIERKKSNIPKNCLEELFDPILHFIHTAKYSLDIAFMLITVKPVLNAVADAHDRGVKVRILLNFSHCDSTREDLKALKNKGIEILTYISPENNMNSIMHYKYMVKDFQGDAGYAFMGSSNLTDNAFFHNYEDMVFTSSKEVVKALNDNFEHCWNFIQAENRTLVNRVILTDADFI